MIAAYGPSVLWNRSDEAQRLNWLERSGVKVTECPRLAVLQWAHLPDKVTAMLAEVR